MKLSKVNYSKILLSKLLLCCIKGKNKEGNGEAFIRGVFTVEICI